MSGQGESDEKAGFYDQPNMVDILAHRTMENVIHSS